MNAVGYTPLANLNVRLGCTVAAKKAAAAGYSPLANLNVRLGCTVAAKEAAAAGTEKGQTQRYHKRPKLPNPSVSLRSAIVVAVANLVAPRTALSEEDRQKETAEAVQVDDKDIKKGIGGVSVKVGNRRASFLV
jgi:phage host-nuclease inhibitor protein Gam